jgi:hypothetical protein
VSLVLLVFVFTSPSAVFNLLIALQLSSPRSRRGFDDFKQEAAPMEGRIEGVRVTIFSRLNFIML